MLSLSAYIKKVLEETKASEISLELKTDDEVNVTSNGNHRVKIKLKKK